MLILGTGLAIPASVLAGLAPSIEVLFIARLLGGLAAGNGIPDDPGADHRALVGPGADEIDRTMVGVGRGNRCPRAADRRRTADTVRLELGLLRHPAARRGRPLPGGAYVPSHVNESTEPVDNLSGDPLGADGRRPRPLDQPRGGPRRRRRRRRARDSSRWRRSRPSPSASGGWSAPLYDLEVAGRRIFWVAACAGIIVFGSLMAAMFVGQQFLQNVLGYSTLDAGLAILPAALLMVVVAPRSAKLVEARGARFTLLAGYAFCLLGFLTMLLLWKEGIAYWKVGLGYAFIGVGVGLAGHARLACADRLGAGAPGGHGLGHRRPPARSRRRDHAVDLRGAADRRLRGSRRRSGRRPRPTASTRISKAS